MKDRDPAPPAAVLHVPRDERAAQAGSQSEFRRGLPR
jgi:hypothetical protein